MKRLTLGALALLLAGSAAAGAESLTITTRWTTVHAGPSASAPAVALVFGNDTLPVLKRADGWVAVRLPRGRQGWVRAQDGAPDVPAAAAATAPEAWMDDDPLAVPPPVRPVGLAVAGAPRTAP